MILFAIGCSGGSAATSPSRVTAGSPADTVSLSSAPALFGARAVDFARCLQAVQDPGCLAGARIQPRAVGAAATAPGAPTNLSASSSGSTVTLTWGAPASGDPVATYMIEAGSAGGLANLANFATNSTGTSFSASGVGAGTYYVRVRAQNAGGVSGASNEAILIVGAAGCTTAPNAPGGLVTSTNGSTVTLTWTAPAAGCAPSSFVLQAGSSAGSSDLANANVGAASSYAASGVGAGTYYVRVRAVNAYGQSAGSNEVVLIVGGSTPSPTSVTGRWVGVAPDGWILDPGADPCDQEWDVQLDLMQSGTAMTGTVTTRVRKVGICGDRIGLVETGSLMNGTVGSGTLSFSLLGERSGILNFTGTFTATRMAGRMIASVGGGGGSFALNRQ